MVKEITSWAGMQQLYRHPAVDSVKVEKVFNDIKDLNAIKDIVEYSLMNTCSVKLNGRVTFNIYFPITKSARLHVHYMRAEGNNYFRVGLQTKQGGRWSKSEPKHIDMVNKDIEVIYDALVDILNLMAVAAVAA